MQPSTKQVTEFASRRNPELPKALRLAHGQLEKRFLDGGAVLLSVMEVLKRLIGSLDLLTGALDEQTTAGTTADILETVRQLSALPAVEERRRESLEAIAQACAGMRDHVADMQETMRYLRTFAVTVKITGAGLAEFSGFAEEILERIHSGTEEVTRFAAQLEAMHRQLQEARTVSAAILGEYAGTVPGIVEALAANAVRVGEHQKTLAAMAAQVGVLARGVQGKIAAVLSALQIGDITRQRIEHVDAALQILDDFLRERGADAGGEERATRLESAVLHLCAAQMRETVEDFRRQCREIVGRIGSFVDDTREILSLRDAMAAENDGGGQTFLHTLEESVSSACDLVSRVREASDTADAAARSATGTVRGLLTGIETVRAIKTDIHYMALNSNLRCSKLGEEGRSINVVTAELRVFAGKLEVSADNVVEQLHDLEKAAGQLAEEQAEGEGLDKPLIRALSTIRDVCGGMEGAIGALSSEGQAVFTEVSAAIARLDFESELGEILDRSADGFAEAAGPAMADLAGLESEAAELGGRIWRIYTMAQERVLHERLLPGAAAEGACGSGPASDDDLFEDALF